MKITDLKLKGTEVTLATQKADPSVLKTLDDTYAEFAKLVFLFDCSSSMTTTVARGITEQYIWEPSKLAAIRSQMEDLVTKANAYQDALAALPDEDWSGGDDPDEDEDEDEDEDIDTNDVPNPLSSEEWDILRALATCDSTGQYTFEPKDDEELKERIVRGKTSDDDNMLLGVLGILPDFTKEQQTPPTRMDLVKKLARREIEARIKRYPKGKISVINFTTWPTVIFDEGDPKELWSSIDHMRAYGGTDILRALKEAVEVCRNKPSEVGLHHFIIVSDGEDNVDWLPGWVPTLKQSGVVMDYIHIGEFPNDTIADVCRQLGGDFVSVNNAADFDRKFVEAVGRKCLPPPID